MPDPVPPPGLDLNLLIDRLAESDSHSRVAPDDATIADLKAQLDTLSDELARPEPADPFADESACRRAVEIVAAIGKDPTFVTAADADRTSADGVCNVEMPASIGQYRILSRLGVGGMGAVYKALHMKLEKVVALKVLPADRLKDTGAIARFEREMRAVGKLHHPNIVAAHDAGEIGGTHYLVMELVEGIDLGTLLKERGCLSVAEACEIVRQAALGLQHAHEHGLVHRDIKPSNLMLSVVSSPSSVAEDASTRKLRRTTDHGLRTKVKVLDLGLALLDSNQRELAGELTSTGQIMGTLDYMAPEQGADTHAVDIRADVYSLGATLYKLLTGRAPFEGPQYNTPMKKLTALATAEPQPVRDLRPDVLPELAAIVHRMLAKSPEQRPTPPAAVAELLRPFAVGADFPRLLHGDSHRLGETLPPSESATDPTVVGPTEVVADAIDGSATPAVALASPPAPPRRRGKRVRTLLKAAAVLVPLALITIQMKQGTVTVRTDEQLAEDVKVVVKSGGEEVAVMDKDNNWTITVRAGEYQVETRGGNDEFAVVRDRIGVSRWGKTIVEIERKPAAIAAASPVQAVPLSGNYCLEFDGRAAHVDIPSLTYDGSHPVTLEARVVPRKRLADDKSTVVIGNIRDRTRQGGLVLRQFDAGWRATVFSDTGKPHYPTATDDSLDPVELALVYDLNETRLYVNGRLAQGVAIAPAKHFPSTEAFFIGGPGGRKDSTYFDGVIDEVRISSTARYSRDYAPSARFEVDEHTLALYHFDEGQGEVLHDASGHGHDGTIVGATWVRSDATLVPRLEGSGPYDPALERPIVEAILQSGGSVSIVVPLAPPNVGARQSYAYGTNLAHEISLLGQEQNVRSIDELPAEPFHVTRVQLRRQAPIDPSLIESLALAPYLFELNLEGSAVNDGHAAVIGRMSQLRSLNVGGTGLSDEGLRELSRLSNLRYLAVSKAPGITDAGLEHIARLTSLVEIYLHENPQLTDRGIAWLRELPHVGWLWLEGTAITDAALESVSGFEELDSLRLSRTKLNGAGLAHLSRLRKLNWLFLHDTEVADEFGVLLKDVQFGSLWLSGTSVGDATLKAIAGRQSIHQLILNGTGITDAGLAHLKGTRIVHLSANNTALSGSGLADLDIVQVLDLSHSQLSDEAAKSLGRYATLEILNVAGTPLSEEAVRSLHEVLPNCTIHSDFGRFEPRAEGSGSGTNFSLHFDGVDDYAELPVSLRDVEQFTFELWCLPDRQPIGEDEHPIVARFGLLDLKIWAEGPQWTAVVWDPATMAPAAASVHPYAPKRTHLAVQWDGMGLELFVDGVRAASLPDPDTAERVLALLQQPQSKSVFLGAALDEAGRIVPNYQFRGRLDEVRLSSIPRYADDFTPADRFEPDEDTLALYHFDEGRGDVLRDGSGNVHDGKIVGATWVHSDRVAAEEILRLGGKVVVLVPDEPEPRTIESVETLPETVHRLAAVDLSYTQVGDEDLARLRPAAGLRALSLDSASRIGDAGLLHLAGLPLRAIDLRNTHVSNAGLPALLQLPALAELSLQHTAVTDAGMAVVARIPGLQNLVLSNNPISDAGVAHLRAVSSLRVLSIYDTQLTDAGLTHLATLTGLEELSLADTAITDAGLKHLLPLTQLHHLFLDRTAISDAGLTDLAALPNLRALFLNGTGISDAGLTRLVTAPVLQEAFLEQTRVTEEGVRQLHAARPLMRIHWDGGVIEPRPNEPDENQRD